MPLPDAEAVAPSAPRELIAAYLNQKGMPLTNENYALALRANAENPGAIPGLRNMDVVASPGDPGQPPAPQRSRTPTRAPNSSGSPDDRQKPKSVSKDERDPIPSTPSMQGGASGIGGDELAAAVLLGLPMAAFAGKKYFDKPNPLQVEGQPGVAPQRAGAAEPAPARGSVPQVDAPAPANAVGVDPNAAMESAMQKALAERTTGEMPRLGGQEPLPGELPRMNAQSRGNPVTIAPQRPGGPPAPATATGIEPVPPANVQSGYQQLIDRLMGKVPLPEIRPMAPRVRPSVPRF